MAKFVYGLMQSLDGYVDHMKLGPPVPAASRHFIEQVRGLTGVIYGSRTYEIMRYWEEDLPAWDAGAACRLSQERRCGSPASESSIVNRPWPCASRLRLRRYPPN
jgi:hypothetical protein